MRRMIRGSTAAVLAAVLAFSGIPADIYAASVYDDTAVYEQYAVTEDVITPDHISDDEIAAYEMLDAVQMEENIPADMDSDGIEALGATSFTAEMLDEWEMCDYTAVKDFPDRTGDYAHSSKFGTYEGVVGIKRYKGSSKNVTIYGDIEFAPVSKDEPGQARDYYVSSHEWDYEINAVTGESEPTTVIRPYKLATVIQYDNVWQTGNGFVPSDTESVTFEDNVFLTSGSYLFCGCSKLKTVDLSPLSGPSQIKGQEDKDYIYDVKYMFFG